MSRVDARTSRVYRGRVPAPAEASCSNCQRPISAGGARGFCARCYQYQRRNDGRLPPRETMTAGDLDAQVTFRLSSQQLREASQAASAEGVELAAWIRRAIAERL